MTSKRARLAAALREHIRQPGVQPGDKLPSENMLASEHGVSRETVRVVLAQLVAEGLIRTEQGTGAYVRDTSPIYRRETTRLGSAERHAGRGAHLTDAADAGRRADVLKLRVWFEAAAVDVAEDLGIEQGEEVAVRERLLGLNSEPTQLATSWLPRSITRGTLIEKDDTGPGGLTSRLEEAGHPVARYVAVNQAANASPDEAAALQIPAGAAVHRLTRYAIGADDLVLEVNRMVLVSRYRVIYEWPAG